MPRALFVGAGDLGSRTARALVADGWGVTALRRRVDALPPGITALRVDLTDPHAVASAPYPEADVLVICVSASARTEDAYRAVYVDGVAGVLAAYARRHGAPRRVVFVSTTAVYHEAHGGLVDETAPTAPERFNGRVMLDAEAAVVASGTAEPVLARLGGIYGTGPNRLLARVRAGEEPVGSAYPDPFTNRIHVDDAATVLAFLVAHPAPPRVLNVVDDEPARRSDVVRFLAGLLGVDVPTTGPPPSAGVPRDDKRVANARLRTLGCALRYPTYREGYRAVLAVRRPSDG